MTLGMVREVLGYVNGQYMFADWSGIEIINANTCANYRKDKKGRITLGGDVINVSEEWVMGLPVTGLKARGNNLIIEVDG